MKKNIRSKALFVPHVMMQIQDTNLKPEDITNLIYETSRDDEYLWIENATKKIGDWRNLARSVYLRWAITINACEIAKKRYATEVSEETALTVDTIRVVEGSLKKTRLALWPARDAADRYNETSPLLVAYGATDLFGALDPHISPGFGVILNLCL